MRTMLGIIFMVWGAGLFGGSLYLMFGSLGSSNTIYITIGTVIGGAILFYHGITLLGDAVADVIPAGGTSF